MPSATQARRQTRDNVARANDLATLKDVVELVNHAINTYHDTRLAVEAEARSRVWWRRLLAHFRPT